MSRLNWGAVGERFFETGVDRGVLYVDNRPGVPWNGLVSVSESPSGGETKSYYIDGIKYLNRSLAEEFEATIEAYTYPSEFAECDGTLAVTNGLFATQQKRKAFSLAYRTRVGNDIHGSDHGYKIHLVYDAMAAPSARSHSTIGSEIEPDNFSWSITTRPPLRSGRKPTSHFVIDSRETPAGLLAEIEDILYGSEDSEARLPTLHELIYRFEDYNSSIFDAGDPNDPFYNEFDAGVVPEPQTSTIDGGAP